MAAPRTPTSGGQGNALPLTGGTLTGALTGTSISLSSTLALSGVLTQTTAGVAATEVDGIITQNTTAATSGTPVQRSPGTAWIGHAHDTNGDVDDQHEWHVQNVPVNGNTTTSKWALSHRVKRGAAAMGSWVDKMTLSDDGVLDFVTNSMVYKAGTDFAFQTASVTKFRINSTGIELSEGYDLKTGTTTGSKIGRGATEKLGLWGATPVVQPTAVTDASGGATIDAEARTALNALLARCRTIGLIAT